MYLPLRSKIHRVGLDPTNFHIQGQGTVPKCGMSNWDGRERRPLEILLCALLWISLYFMRAQEAPIYQECILVTIRICSSVYCTTV